jgi:hypothetical protein
MNPTNPTQFFIELKRRRNLRTLAMACVTAGLFVIVAATMMLAVFEAAAGGLKVLGRTLALGKAHAPVRRLDRPARYEAHSCGWRT